MVLNQSNSDSNIDRRAILKAMGAGGMISIAGCLGGDDDGDADISFPLELQLEVNSDNDDRVQMVELIAESFEQSGYFETELETYDWDTYTDRVLDEEYPDRGHVPCIGLSGTFNPHSFCEALHHQANQAQCCNMNGLGDDELDEMLDGARYGMDVAQDPDLRAERYDEIWHELAEYAGSSISHFGLNTGVTSTDVHNFSAWPFSEQIVSYPVYAAGDQQLMWVDRDTAATGDDDWSDYVEGGTLIVGAAENPQSYDPPYSSDTTSTMAQANIFESLTTSDEQGNIYPWLAESYEVVDVQDVDRAAYEDHMITADADEDGVIDTDEQIIVTHPGDDPFGEDEVRILTPDGAADAVADGTYGMHIRYDLEEGVNFHNGDEMTADDVVASLRRYENSDVDSQTFDSILHIEADGDYTVHIYGQIPDAEGERELPGFVIMPEEQAELPDNDLDPRQGNDPIGTGPYMFEEIDDNSEFVEVRNEDYWMHDKGIENKEWFDGPADFPNGPVIDRIEYRVIAEDPTRQAALQSGEIDLTYGLAADQLDGFEADDDFITDSVEAGGYTYIQYPVQIEPFDDERLRQALNHLVPREDIVDNVFAGWAEEAWTMLPTLARGGGTADFDALESDIRPYNEFDPEAAAQLIEEVIEDHGYGSDV